MYDTTYLKQQVLKHVSTRWLGKGSLSYVGKVPALENLFFVRVRKAATVKRLTKQFENPMTEVCLLGKAYLILLNIL